MEEGGGFHFLCIPSEREIKKEKMDQSTNFEIKAEDSMMWDQVETNYLEDEVEEKDMSNITFVLDDDDEDDVEDTICDTEDVDCGETSSGNIIGRDKETVWNTRPSDCVKYAFFAETPGSAMRAQHCKTPQDAWSLLFTDEILHQIVESTNEQINSKTKTDRSSHTTTIAEIKAVIGLTYIIGTLKASHMNTLWLWATDGTGVEIFPCVMSQRRFIFLLRSLRFAHSNAEDIWPDPFGPFRPVFEQFVSNCTTNYVMHEKCDLDATLVGFRGECPFLRYMRHKVAQYGIKVYCLVDRESQYMYNMDVCLDSSRDIENTRQVVQKLCTPIMGTGRTVTYNHRFGSIALAEYLHERGIHTVSALKKSSREIPSMAIVKKKLGPSMRCYRIGTLVCDSPLQDERYVLYSTLPESGSEINETQVGISKFYEECRKGVGLTVESCTSLTSSRKSSRWPLTMFYFLLNVAGCNAQVIIENNLQPPESIGSMEFLKNLGRALVHDQLVIRSRMTTVPKMLHLKIKQFAGLQENAPWRSELAIEPPFKKLKRCEMCKRQADRKTKEWCIKCRIAVCKDHGVKVCQNCVVNFLV